MASLLSVTGAFPSTLYPSVELARRLAAAGHRMTVAGLPAARELVAHHGLDFLSLEPSRYEDFLADDARRGPLARLLDLRRRRARARDSMAVDGFAGAVRDLAPDLVLVDGEMHEHVIAASATGAPIALVNTFASIWRRPGLPPPHCLVRPGVGWRGSRIGLWLLWTALRWRKRRRALGHRIRRVGCDRLSILRRLAREAGFDFRRETDAGHWLIPFTYRRLPVLSLHALEFEFPHRPLERVHYVGPMVLETRVDRSLAADDRARLDAIFERRREGGRKLIYAAFGTAFSTDRDFLRRLLAVVAERDWELVVSLAERAPSGDPVGSPERVHAFAWVPQTEVLRHADAVVTHGGINTLDECVIAGVPVLVHCGGETDMAGNAARVVHHGIGLAGDRRRDTPETIRGHLDRLLTEASFARNVGRLRRHYLAYGEDRVAERVVESLLARRDA